MDPPAERLARFRGRWEGAPSPAPGPVTVAGSVCRRAGYESPGATHPSPPDAGLRRCRTPHAERKATEMLRSSA